MMPYDMNDKVRVNAKVLVKNQESQEMETRVLANVTGTIVKVDGANNEHHYYVKTPHGTHYLHNSKVSDMP